jgi:hypothetical protein
MGNRLILKIFPIMAGKAGRKKAPRPAAATGAASPGGETIC